METVEEAVEALVRMMRKRERGYTPWPPRLLLLLYYHQTSDRSQTDTKVAAVAAVLTLWALLDRHAYPTRALTRSTDSKSVPTVRAI